MTKPFYGVSKMPTERFYCEAEWHGEEARGPLRGNRWQASLDVTDWPSTRQRKVRASGTGLVFVKFPSGQMYEVPGRLCGACMMKLKDVLRHGETEGQEAMF